MAVDDEMRQRSGSQSDGSNNCEVKVCLPGQDIPESYFQCRYDVLRHPLGFPIGSERLIDDSEAIHAWVERDGVVLCVGRAHLIDESSDGSAADHAGPGASICPAFGPLQQINSQNRPSIQIRQMGTRQQGRRQGLATTVLAALEANSIQHFSAKTGFLQAREAAFSFYQSQHWQMIDTPYIIEKIGPHHSMMKQL
jgi:predicted GNAT family N-acyltransferase